MSDRKRRNDSWDAGLTDAQRWEAYEKAKGLAWYAFAAWVQEEYGLSLGKTAFYNWMAAMRAQEGQHRLERAITARRELKDLANAGSIDAKTADAYMALANDALMTGDPDKAAKIVAAAVQINAASLRLQEQRLQHERLKLQEKQVALNREKFEAQERRLNEASKTATDETLSADERLNKIKAIFGLQG